MNGEKKEEKTFYITHHIELLMWLLVILVIVAAASFSNMKKMHEDNDYSIYMNDVDGLIVGSPVRMMGIEVGHITKIKPTNEEVYVKFIIPDESIELPQGTVATVEFSGMAGSKSLELYLPNKDTYIDKDVPILTVNSPKRLHDAMGLLNDMFDKLGSIINTTSSFGQKVQLLSPINNNNDNNNNDNDDINNLIKYSDNMLNDSTYKINEIDDKLKKYKQGREKHFHGTK